MTSAQVGGVPATVVVRRLASRRRVRLLVPPAVFLLVLLVSEGATSAIFARTRAACTVIDIQQPEQLLVKLDFLRRFRGLKVVVLGDSLIYGQAMELHGDPRWREHTLAAILERELRARWPDREILVLNLGIDGIVPVDLDALARLVLPCEVDLLVFDLHLRPFSSDFAEESTQYGRPWLRTIRVDGRGRFSDERPTTSWAQRAQSSIDDFLTNHWYLYRARKAIQARLVQSRTTNEGRRLWQRLAGSGGHDGADEDPHILLLKIKHRLRGVNFRADNPQRRALESLLAYLKGQNQATLVFYARENPELLPSMISERAYRAARDELDGIVGAHVGDRIVYVPSAPGLNPTHYLDYLHLYWSGYELLAAHLLPDIERLLTRSPPGSSMSARREVPG